MRSARAATAARSTHSQAPRTSPGSWIRAVHALSLRCVPSDVFLARASWRQPKACALAAQLSLPHLQDAACPTASAVRKRKPVSHYLSAVRLRGAAGHATRAAASHHRTGRTWPAPRTLKRPSGVPPRYSTHWWCARRVSGSDHAPVAAAASPRPRTVRVLTGGACTRAATRAGGCIAQPRPVPKLACLGVTPVERGSAVHSDLRGHTASLARK